MILGMWHICIIPYWLKLAPNPNTKGQLPSLSLSLSLWALPFPLWHTPPKVSKCVQIPTK
jgi:hypothetical protein